MDLLSLPQTSSKRMFMLPAHLGGDITAQHRQSLRSVSSACSRPASRPPYQLRRADGRHALIWPNYFLISVPAITGVHGMIASVACISQPVA